MINSNNSPFVDLELDLIFASSTNPRKNFDEKDLNSLADSIKVQGVLQPIIVRKGTDPEGKAGYEIVAGERRVRASRIAELTHIPARVADLSDEEVLEIQIIENLQRKNVDPLEEAAAFKFLKDKIKNFDVEEIARRVGKTNVYVYQRIKLLDLCDRGQELLKKNEITLGHANHLCKLPNEAQEKVLDWMITTNDENGSIVSVESPVSVKNFIKKSFHLDLNKAPWDKADVKLCPEAGACKLCPKRTGYNLNLFDEIEESDSCLDSECYNKKMDAFIESEIKRFKKEKLTLHKISPSYFFQQLKKEGILYLDDYTSENSMEQYEIEQIPDEKWKHGIYVSSNKQISAGQIIRFVDQDFYDDFEFKDPEEEESTTIKKPTYQEDESFDLTDWDIQEELDRRVTNKILEGVVLENKTDHSDHHGLNYVLVDTLDNISFAYPLCVALGWKIYHKENITEEDIDTNDKYYFQDCVDSSKTVTENIHGYSMNQKIKLLNLILKIYANECTNNQDPLLDPLLIDKTEIIAQYKKEWEAERGIVSQPEPEPEENTQKPSAKKKKKGSDDNGASVFVSSLLS